MLFGIADSVVRGGFFVCLPFLLLGKGAAVTTAGFALTLVFVGGAAGKLACGWIGHWLGSVATIAICQTLTAVGIVAVLLLPLQLTLIVLPFVGLVLNGVTTVIYGSVPSYAAPERRTHALSVFYTITIGAAAASPPAAGFIGDLIGIPGTVAVVSALMLATIPLRHRVSLCAPGSTSVIQPAAIPAISSVVANQQAEAKDICPEGIGRGSRGRRLGPPRKAPMRPERQVLRG